MHWGSFFKGSFLAVFLLFLGLTCASLAYQLKPAEPVYIAAAPHFPAVLAAEAPPREFHDVSVLLLGLDSRKGDKSARCDAIHTISFLPSENKIIITSVPRGSPSKEGNIIANVCSIYGFATAKEEVEKITGVYADYVVKVGFSQAQGALRLVDLPPSETLQFLRNRNDYLIGDNQRSYNQANFLKDSILRYTQWAAKLPEPMQHLAFNIVDTDLPYDQGKELFREFLDSGLYKNPDNIEIVIRPKDNWVREEIHVEDKVNFSEDFQSDPEFKSYQDDVAGYLENITKNNYLDKINLAIAKKLWLQIEDDTLRNFWQNKLDKN